MHHELTIIDSEKPETHKSLGQQVIDNHAANAGQYTQDVRETTDEMGKKWNSELESIIYKHRWVKGKYYINIILKKEIMFENVLKAIFVIRKTRPTPEWNSTLYSYDNDESALRLEWVLPGLDEAHFIMNDPLGWDAAFVTFIKDHMKGELK